MKEKPTPGELRNVDVGFISLVDRGANKRQFKIFKSADWPGDEGDAGIDADKTDSANAPEGSEVEKSGAPEADRAEDQEMKGFFQTVKEFFLKRFGVARAPEECRGGEVEKAGRKISAARLAALKEAHSLLAQIIAEAEADGDSGKGETGVTKEELEGVMGEVLKQVQESLKNGLAPIEERVANLEKADEESKKALEESIKKTVEPLEQRIETIEKARGVSQSIPADGVQDKPGGTFAGVIFGRR